MQSDGSHTSNAVRRFPSHPLLAEHLHYLAFLIITSRGQYKVRTGLNGRKLECLGRQRHTAYSNRITVQTVFMLHISTFGYNLTALVPHTFIYISSSQAGLIRSPDPLGVDYFFLTRLGAWIMTPLTGSDLYVEKARFITPLSYLRFILDVHLFPKTLMDERVCLR